MGKAAVNVGKIVEFIKSSKEPVDRKQILNATGYGGDFNYAMKLVVNGHDDIERIGDRSHVLYIYNPKKSENSEMKNPEGYADSTAGKAIRNVMRRTENDGKFPMSQKFGEVWGISSPKDSCEGILVVSAKGGTCIGYYVYPDKQNFMKPAYTKAIKDPDGHLHYIYILSMINAKVQGVREFKFKVSADDAPSIREYVMNVLNIEPPTVYTVDPAMERKLGEYREQVDKLLDENKKLRDDVEPLLSENKKLKENIENMTLRIKCEIYEKLLFERKA